MNDQEAKAYIENTSKYGSILGLENITELLSRLGNPQDRLSFIHIAGTNGKGSVLTYVSTVLFQAGYKVGRYISPTICTYEERIQLNGCNIEKEDMARILTRIAKVIDQMLEDGMNHPTQFEIETTLGFLYFDEMQCDIVVLETGMGGTTDATNIVKNTIMAIITSVSMDHMDYLGNTIEEIAAAKAGIIKPGSVVVTIRQSDEVIQVIQNKCIQVSSPCVIADIDNAYDITYGYDVQSFSYRAGIQLPHMKEEKLYQYKDIQIRLAGSYQIENAVLALSALKTLTHIGYKITNRQLRDGFIQARLQGRFTVVAGEPLFIIDGAHNKDAASKLRESIQLYFKGKRIHYIMGVFADKDYESIIKLTAPLAYDIITIEPPNNKRALPAQDLARAVSRYNPSVRAADSICEAVTSSLKKAKKEDVIIAFGSLSFLGDIITLFA